jgi:hypothetical protein
MPRDGVCRCRYWRRYRGDDLDPNALGYRAVQLATVRGLVRLRLVEDEIFRLLDGTQLRVSRPSAKKPEELTTLHGLAITREEYPHFALVEVGPPSSPYAFVPVAIVDDRPVDCRIKVRPEAPGLAALESRRDSWVRHLYDEIGVVAYRTGKCTGLLNQSLSDALQEGQSGLKNLDAELKRLIGEREEIVRLTRDLKPAPKLDLREG